MAGFGATEFSPYSQWWGNNAMGQGVQTNPVPDNTAEAKQLPPLGQEAAAGADKMQNRGKLANAMMFSQAFQQNPLMATAAYLKNQGYGLGLGSKIAGLFGG